MNTSKTELAALGDLLARCDQKRRAYCEERARQADLVGNTQAAAYWQRQAKGETA